MRKIFPKTMYFESQYTLTSLFHFKIVHRITSNRSYSLYSCAFINFLERERERERIQPAANPPPLP